MKVTQSFVAFACVVVLVSSSAVDHEEIGTKLRRHQRECQNDPNVHVSEDILSNFEDDKEVDQHLLYKHAVCALRKQGYLRDDGEFDLDVFKADLRKAYKSEKEVENLVKVCVVEKEDVERVYYKVQHFWRCLFF